MSRVCIRKIANFADFQLHTFAKKNIFWLFEENISPLQSTKIRADDINSKVGDCFNVSCEHCLNVVGKFVCLNDLTSSTGKK